MSVAFRNVVAPAPGAPVSEWPYEALVAAIERGTVGDWAPITRAIRRDPWGVVARRVEDYLGYAHPYGVGPLLAQVVESARAERQAQEREQVAAAVRAAIERSGLTREEFASRIGTSRSRLSTYVSGRVVPAATVLVRMQRVADSAADDAVKDAAGVGGVRPT